MQTLGINETLLAQLTNAEETTADLLANCENLAQLVVAHDLSTAFSHRIVPRTFVDSQSFGVPDDARELQTMDAGTKGGIVVEIDQRKSNVTLRVGVLGAWLDGTEALEVKIYDVATGALVDTQTVQCTIDELSVTNVQIELPANKIKKAYFISHERLTFYKMLVADSGCGSCGVAGWLHGGVHVWGARLGNALPVKRSNLQNVSHTSGLFSVITVECNHAQLFCEVKNAIALPYLYKLGEVIVDRAIHAFERLNSQTMDKDALIDRRDRLGSEYAAAMRNTVGKMRLPDDPMCFQCESRTYSAIAAP